MQTGGCTSKKHVIWHGMNNIKMEVGVQPHIGTALFQWQSAFWVYWAGDLVGRKPDWTGRFGEKKKLSSCTNKIFPFTSDLMPYNDRLWFIQCVESNSDTSWLTADKLWTAVSWSVYQCLKSPSHSNLERERERERERVCVCVCMCVCVRVYRLEAALCEGGRQAVDLVEVVTN